MSEKAALLHDFTIWSGESEVNPVVEPRSFVATGGESHFAPANGVWYGKGGLFVHPRAKFNDLAKHIWLPVEVIAASGTAGMIRVMRGDLLDELRKPCVTTAMAKGMRPFKLLMKYPVRLALNPFISGIGHIFPALISGGAIVAIVLSLPMVGPILL